MHKDAYYCELGRTSVFIDCRRDAHSPQILRRNCGIYQQCIVTFDPRGVRPSSLVFWKALLMHMNANYCDLECASVFIDCWRDEHSAKILRRNCGIYQQYIVTFDPRGVRPSSLVFWKALLMHMDADYCDLGRTSVFIDCRRDAHSPQSLRRNFGVRGRDIITTIYQTAEVGKLKAKTSPLYTQ